jgi:ribosomal-protein-alanine N-acetyltransferase
VAEVITPQISEELVGRRITMRPLNDGDFSEWHEIRARCADWLLPWEPRAAGAPYPSNDRSMFVARCAMRERERQLGTAFGFGFFAQGRLCGEINLSSIHRGPFQSGYVGYWVDREHAGKGYTPEASVLMFRFAFEELGLHRLQISIVPRNRASRRVAQKLWLRGEGIALRYLEIDGKWEDHVRYAITAEEWYERRDRYINQWLSSTGHN